MKKKKQERQSYRSKYVRLYGFTLKELAVKLDVCTSEMSGFMRHSDDKTIAKRLGKIGIKRIAERKRKLCY